MPYQITWEERGVYKKFTGFLNAEEFLKSLKDVQADPRIDTVAYSINDVLEVLMHSLTEEQIKGFAEFAFGTLVSNPNIVVIIVTSNTKLINVVRKNASVFDKNQLQMFSTLEEARNWIKENID